MGYQIDFCLNMVDLHNDYVLKNIAYGQRVYCARPHYIILFSTLCANFLIKADCSENSCEEGRGLEEEMKS